MSRVWKQTRTDRWDSTDGAVVKIDETVQCDTSRPWLPNYRGWKAWGPGTEQHNYLGFFRKNSRFRIVRKFKTAEAGMAAVDKEFPVK